MKRWLAILTLTALLVGLIVSVPEGLQQLGTREGIHGTITRDGKPLEWESEGGYLLVLFIPPSDQQDPIRAEVSREEGTFRVDRIAAGTYRVAIQQFDDNHNDSLGHVYDPAETTLQCVVKENQQQIDIDLPRQLPASRKGGGGGMFDGGGRGRNRDRSKEADAEVKPAEAEEKPAPIPAEKTSEPPSEK